MAQNNPKSEEEVLTGMCKEFQIPPMLKPFYEGPADDLSSDSSEEDFSNMNECSSRERPFNADSRLLSGETANSSSSSSALLKPVFRVSFLNRQLSSWKNVPLM